MNKWIQLVIFLVCSTIFIPIVCIILGVDMQKVLYDPNVAIDLHQWNIVIYQFIKDTTDMIGAFLFFRAFGLIDFIKHE
jgi:hypothetical protein